MIGYDIYLSTMSKTLVSFIYFRLNEKKHRTQFFFKSRSLFTKIPLNRYEKSPKLPNSPMRFNHIPLSHEFPRIQKSSFSPSLESDNDPSSLESKKKKEKKKTSKDSFLSLSSLNPKNKAQRNRKKKKRNKIKTTNTKREGKEAKEFRISPRNASRCP